MEPFKHRPALVKAINHAGSQAALAKKIGKQQGHIWFWLHEAKKLSPSIAIKIEHATKGEVSRSDLCPELSPEYQP